jgi:hypothetical protein
VNDHRLEVADVFRTHEDDFLARWGHVLSPRQKKAFADIRDCRTAALGGHVEHYDCGIASSHITRAPTAVVRSARVGTSQVAGRTGSRVAAGGAVFSRGVYADAKTIYSILFRAVAETMLTIAADPKHLGATIGFLAVLHSWGQNLHFHPHIHCVVPGGGISPDNSRWIACRKSFFLPVEVRAASSVRGS